MSPQELNREIAQATGESVRTIAEMGFVPLTAVPYEREENREPLTVDWDDLDSRRHMVHPVS